MEDIGCLSTVLGCPISVERAEAVTSPSSNMGPVDPFKTRGVNSLSTDFLNLLNNPELSDVTFILKNKQRWFAHKNVLTARSPYFRSLFLNGMKETFETEKEIEVSEWDPSIFETVMRFIYTDQLKLSDFDLDSLWELYLAARYYGLDRLCKLCEHFLSTELLTPETASSIWKTAVDLDAKKTETACLRYFEQNFESISKTQSFLELPKELLMKVLRSEELVVSANHVIMDAILNWSKAQLADCENKTEAKKNLFCEFFPVLRMKRKWTQPQNLTAIKTAVGTCCMV